MLYGLCVCLFLIFSMILILLIVIQDWKTANLGSGLGLHFASDPTSAFGSDLPMIVRRVTAWMIGGFLVGALFISCWTVHLGRNNKTKPVLNTALASSMSVDE